MAETGSRVPWASLVALTVSSTPIAFYTQSLFLAPVTREFGWTRNGYFSAVLAGGVAGAIATPLIGRLFDRVGVRPVLVAGIVVFALLNAALGLIGGSLPAYIGMSALVATAGVVQGPLPYAKAITGWFDRRRGIAIAIALSGTGIGGVLIPPITAWLIAAYGWRGARFGLGALVLAVALPAVLAFVRERPGARTAADPTQDGVTLRTALRDPTLWLLAGAFLLSSVVVNGTLANLAAIVGRQGAPVAAVALSALAVGQIGGRLISGWLLDRVLTARIGAIWYGAAMIGLALLGSTGATATILLGSLLVGAGVGAELEMAAVFTSRFFGRRHFGAINGTIFSAYLVGAAAGPLVASALVTADGSYARMILIGIGALAAAAGLLFATGRYRYLPAAG